MLILYFLFQIMYDGMIIKILCKVNKGKCLHNDISNSNQTKTVGIISQPKICSFHTGLLVAKTNHPLVLRSLHQHHIGIFLRVIPIFYLSCHLCLLSILLHLHFCDFV